jgi:hypothetical protein
MFKAGLSKTDLTAVSDVGTYSTTFTLADDWNKSNGLTLDLGQIDGMTGVTVNGVEFKVNIVSCIVDISPALKVGKNELVVKIATSTANYATNGRAQTARAFPDSINSGLD